MKSLEQYLRKEDQNSLLEYYNIENINKWLYETYEEHLNIENISESQFYHNKFNFSTLDTPEYWFWQDKLYENLNHSIMIDSNIFGKLFKQIKGITEVIIDNKYSVGLKYNDNFSEGSDEFDKLLNFGNYFIRSKRDENNKLPNPFFIEAKRPKELIDYKYKEAYHLTNKYAYEKIKKYGLIPKSKSKISNYEYRIYLWVPEYLNKNDIESYGRISLRLYKDSINNNDKHNLNNLDIINDLILLKINLEKFENDHQKQLKLFGDPSYNKKSAVFTLEPIPTQYIEKISINEIN